MAAPIMPMTLSMLRVQMQLPYQTAAQRRRQYAQAYYRTPADQVDFEPEMTRSYSSPPTPCALRSGWAVAPLYRYPFYADDDERMQ